jgi:hypothetical protein
MTGEALCRFERLVNCCAGSLRDSVEILGRLERFLAAEGACETNPFVGARQETPTLCEGSEQSAAWADSAKPKAGEDH